MWWPRSTCGKGGRRRMGATFYACYGGMGSPSWARVWEAYERDSGWAWASGSFNVDAGRLLSCVEILSPSPSRDKEGQRDHPRSCAPSHCPVVPPHFMGLVGRDRLCKGGVFSPGVFHRCERARERMAGMGEGVCPRPRLAGRAPRKGYRCGPKGRPWSPPWAYFLDVSF